MLWVCHISRDELHNYTRLRQKHLTSLNRSVHCIGTTILVTDIPRNLLFVEKLMSIYNVYPGGVRNVLIHRDCSELAHWIRKRDRLALKLESAETKLIQEVQLNHDKLQKHAPSNEKTMQISIWKARSKADTRETIGLTSFKIPWLSFIPSLGKRVDLIDYYRRELHLLNSKIQEKQQAAENLKALGCAFINFNRPIGAHMACQSIQHPQPHSMIAKYIEESPNHIIRKNVSMTWWERYFRITAVGSLVTSLLFIFVIPVAFTGLLSQLNYLVIVFPWLDWLNNLSNWTLALLQGVLPPTLLAVIMLLVPLILQFLIVEQGVHSRIAVELLMQNYYFAFLFVQIFAVISVISSVAAVLNGLSHDIDSTAMLLIQSLPKASNYFFSYMLLQGVSVSASALLQLDRLFQFAFGLLVDNTARQKWERNRKPGIQWGTFFPVYTNLAVIGLSLELNCLKQVIIDLSQA